MLSRIQDLPRYQADIKRFKLGIDSTEGDLKEEGQQLFTELYEAVSTFDSSTIGLLVQKDHGGHLDHANAQEEVKRAKDKMEMWMIRNAPNIHVDEQEFIEKPLEIESDK